MRRELDAANRICATTVVKQAIVTSSAHTKPGGPSLTSRVSGDQFSLPISKSFLIPVRLTTKDGPISLTALIDSGVALNLINKDIVKKYSLTTLPCVPTICITDVNNKPIEGGLPDKLHLLSYRLDCSTEKAFLSISLIHPDWNHPRIPLAIHSRSCIILESWRIDSLVWILSNHCMPVNMPQPCLTTSAEDPASASVKIPPTIRTFQMCSQEQSFTATTSPSWDCTIDLLPMPCHPRVRYTHYHAMNPRLWKITLKRLWTLVLLGPLPLQQQRGSSSLRRMEVYDLALITEVSTMLL